MKKIIYLLFFLFLAVPSAESQILKKIQKRAEQAAEKAVLQKTDEKVSEETNKGLDNVLGEGNEQEQASQTGNVASGPVAQSSSGNAAVSPKAEAWTKYDFVPGEKIIFEDDLSSEENGEFPSRWDLLQGSADNARLGETNIINFENKTIITPLMDNNEYLPDVFTLEFDAYFDSESIGSLAYYQRYLLRFWNGTSHYKLPGSGPDFYRPLEIYRHGAQLDGKIDGSKRTIKAYEESLNNRENPEWRHIAIAFNERSLKVYVDEFRAINLPNLGFKPKMLSIEGYSHSADGVVRAIKNIRIAEGGKNLYDRVAAEGKYVTRGILFDTNQASLKPESMGVINEISKMMKAHPELRFRIEGHTDSDGEDAYNLQLSKKRALAVREALAGTGIEPERMQAKGLGETIPVSDNSTPEGKANNRRVEFIKI